MCVSRINVKKNGKNKNQIFVTKSNQSFPLIDIQWLCCGILEDWRSSFWAIDR